MEHITNAPFHLSGPDFYCPDCGRLLVHVLEDGSFEHPSNVHLQCGGKVEEFADDGRPMAFVMEANCGDCHPNFHDNVITKQLPPEVRAAIAKALGITDEDIGGTDPRIQEPWS